MNGYYGYYMLVTMVVKTMTHFSFLGRRMWLFYRISLLRFLEHLATHSQVLIRAER